MNNSKTKNCWGKTFLQTIICHDSWLVLGPPALSSKHNHNKKGNKFYSNFVIVGFNDL